MERSGVRSARVRRSLMGLAVAVALSACTVPVVTYGGTDAGPLTTRVLTPDGPPSYRFTVGPGTVGVASLVPGSSDPTAGGSQRYLIWPADAPRVRDAQSCVTWSDERGGMVQEGVALRVVPGPGGSVRAITVTKNVWLGFYFSFNIHTWDTSGARPKPYEAVGSVDLHDTFVRGGQYVALPWRLCARVQGSRLDLKVWPVSSPEPDWEDPLYGTTITLPAGWDEPGYAGWYVGHLRSGGSVKLSDLETAKLVPAGT